MVIRLNILELIQAFSKQNGLLLYINLFDNIYDLFII